MAIIDWDSQSLYTAAILENGGPNILEGAVRRFGGLEMETVYGYHCITRTNGEHDRIDWSGAQ